MTKKFLNKRNISVHRRLPQPKTCMYIYICVCVIHGFNLPQSTHDNQKLAPTLCPVQAKVT